jgi:DNA-binding SARP family transcriptional activator
MHVQDQLEIRLLGSTLVRRRDGEAVPPKEWRTAKSLELVRLLALNPDHPVPVDVVLDRLWPSAPTKKAQASLRTATYHVRLVLGDDAIERRSDGLALSHVWTDVRAYAMLADEIEAARSNGELAEVAGLARAAEALYVGDIDTEGSGEWMLSAQEQWREQHLTVLLASCEAAVALGQMHEAIDLANAARRLEPSCERAVRVLMRAYAATGEIAKALSAFERLKDELADAYGADPAPQTRALHLELLTSTACAVDGARPSDALVGHDDAVDTLTAVLLHMRGAGERLARPGVVWLLGDAGTGKTTVVQAACKRARLRLASAEVSWEALADQSPRSAPSSGEVLVTAQADGLTGDDAARLHAWAQATANVLVVTATELSTDVLDAALGAGDMPVAPLVRLDPLGGAHTEELLRMMLQGDPAPELVTTVTQRTGSRSGEICRLVRQWLHAGRIIWTPQGMTLSTEADKPRVLPGTSGRVLRSLSTLDFRAVEALAVVAVLDGSASVSDVELALKRLRPEQLADARELLDTLVDAGLLRTTDSDYRMRNSQDRAELLAWFRPGALRAITLAATGGSTEDTSEGLQAVGAEDVALACREGDFVRARHLLEAMADATPPRAVGLLVPA